MNTKLRKEDLQNIGLAQLLLVIFLSLLATSLVMDLAAFAYFGARCGLGLNVVSCTGFGEYWLSVVLLAAFLIPGVILGWSAALALLTFLLSWMTWLSMARYLLMAFVAAIVVALWSAAVASGKSLGNTLQVGAFCFVTFALYAAIFWRLVRRTLEEAGDAPEN